MGKMVNEKMCSEQLKKCAMVNCFVLRENGDNCVLAGQISI